jgi:hypothetical protein
MLHFMATTFIVLKKYQMKDEGCPMRIMSLICLQRVEWTCKRGRGSQYQEGHVVMEHSAQRTEKQVSGTVSWREEMLGLGIIAAGLDTSAAILRATTTPGNLDYLLVSFIALF